MPRHGKEINLSSGINDILNFKDPRLSDAEFEKRLVWEIYNDDMAVRDGTSSSDYVAGTLKNAQRNVAEAISENGLKDRNKVISSAYNKASNSRPGLNFPKTESPFLEGSDYLEYARGVSAGKKLPKP